MLSLFHIYFFPVFSSKETDRKKLMDPLQNMTTFLEAKKSHNRDKERKHKEKHKRQRDTEKNSKTQPKKSVEQMRKERLRREQEEHERERKLLASVRGESSNEGTTDLSDGHDTYRYSLIETYFLFSKLWSTSCWERYNLFALLPLLIISITKFLFAIGSPRVVQYTRTDTSRVIAFSFLHDPFYSYGS